MAAVLATLAGITLASSLQALQLPPERVNGHYEREGDLGGWWLFQRYGQTNIPSAVPSQLSSNASSPTLLGTTSANYTVNAATAGSAALSWRFLETTAVPKGSEVELTFGISLGVLASVQVKVYFETAASTLTSNATILLYFQTGALAPGTIDIQSVTELAVPCTPPAPGGCP
ncbi:MAG: hypothetical protein L3K18_01885 [Thermoplasmata archaeon]|nr:hypothetical protein [Thermoplasmata archaeon]